MQQRPDDSSHQSVTVEEQTGRTHSMQQVPSQLILTLIDSLTEGVFVIDKEWRYTYLNRLAEELVGRPREELLGKNVWKLFPEAIDTVIYIESMKAVQEQQARQFEVFYPPLNKWFESKIYPTHEGLVVFSRDITEQKHAEAEMARYAAIVTSSDDAIVSKTLDGTITSWNTAAERMFGYPAEEAIGQPITLIIPPELHQEEVDILGKLRRGIRIQHYETVRLRKDGTKVAVSLSISPVKDRAGNIIGAAKIARDITERLELERRKDEFISMASHELKTPITTLKGFTQLLRRKLEGQGLPEAVPTLTKMEAQVNRLTRLIDELLDVSKIQAGRVDYEEEPVDLAALLRETVELQANKVDLSITVSNMTVTLRVRDYGVGIPKADQKNIFDRFYRVRDRHQAFSGLGLGLYITHEIVKQHGGDITVESEEGKGSTFVVSLPLKKN